MSLPVPDDWSSMLAHLEAAYPDEGCGLVLERDGRRRFRPMANAYDRYAAKLPDRFPRTARTAYLFDPREQQQVYEEADREGERIVCIVHSHADVGAYFSEEDRRAAAPDGEVLHPGVEYLVVAIDSGRATAARLYRRDGATWVETRVPLP